MKILKYGKVIVIEDDIIVKDFEVDGEGKGFKFGFGIWAIVWALKKLITKLYLEVNK